MTKGRESFEVKVEVGRHTNWHDVYVTHNGYQWSGLSCWNLDELQEVHQAIGDYLGAHQPKKSLDLCDHCNQWVGGAVQCCHEYDGCTHKEEDCRE